jgi:hypothetical protein
VSRKKKNIDRKQSDRMKVDVPDQTPNIIKRVLYGDDWTCFYIEIT